MATALHSARVYRLVYRPRGQKRFIQIGWERGLIDAQARWVHIVNLAVRRQTQRIGELRLIDDAGRVVESTVVE